MLDLDAARAARREARGLTGGQVPVKAAGNTYLLPPEVPVDCFAPLETVDLDLSVLFSAGIEPERIIRDMVVARPQVVKQALEAAKAVAARLFCDEGPRTSVDGEGTLPRDPDTHGQECQWTRFIADVRPSTQDLVDLGRGLLREYGLNLGESSGSPEPSTSGGPTSKQTATDTATGSTPGESGSPPAAKAS